MWYKITLQIPKTFIGEIPKSDEVLIPRGLTVVSVVNGRYSQVTMTE